MKVSSKGTRKYISKTDKSAGIRSISTTYSLQSLSNSPVKTKTGKTTKKVSKKLLEKSKGGFKTGIKKPKMVSYLNFDHQNKQRRLMFPCFLESDVLIFPKNVKNKILHLTQDFDIDSDDETIDSAVKCQERRIKRVFSH